MIDPFADPSVGPSADPFADPFEGKLTVPFGLAVHVVVHSFGSDGVDCIISVGMGLLDFDSDQISFDTLDGKVCFHGKVCFRGNGFLLDVLGCRQSLLGNVIFFGSLGYLGNHLDFRNCWETVDIVGEASRDEEHLDIAHHG